MTQIAYPPLTFGRPNSLLNLAANLFDATVTATAIRATAKIWLP